MIIIKPTLKINGHDYTKYLSELSAVRNDLDSDGSGRNLLDGLMYRSRIAQKDSWTVNFLQLTENVIKAVAADIGSEYADITLLDPKTNKYLTKSYYTSTLNYGTQRYDKKSGLTIYDGCNFNIVER